MDWNRIIQMIINRLIGRVVNSGIDYAARRGKGPSEMTREERDSARTTKDLTKRARQLSRLTRRF